MLSTNRDSCQQKENLVSKSRKLDKLRQTWYDAFTETPKPLSSQRTKEGQR
jgi:hypothetical protein